MTVPTDNLRIGDVAKLAGTTPRTIRYYEEIGLLPDVPGRPSGGHRLYTRAEVERLREVMRLKKLLGVTLQELKDLLTAEEARAAVRAELRRDDVHPERRRENGHQTQRVGDEQEREALPEAHGAIGRRAGDPHKRDSSC